MVNQLFLWAIFNSYVRLPEGMIHVSHELCIGDPSHRACQDHVHFCYVGDIQPEVGDKLFEKPKLESFQSDQSPIFNT